ncbi:hypothetical protein D3C84_492830 [compost metagenome]
MDRNELGGYETSHVDHFQVDRFGEVRRFPRELSQFGEKRVGDVYQRIRCQIVVTNFHDAWSELETLGLRVFTHVPQRLQGENHALCRALVDAGCLGNFCQIHCPLACVECTQYG